MTGSAAFAIRRASGFDKALASLFREHYRQDRKGQDALVELLARIIDDLAKDPCPSQSRQEPWPRTAGCQPREGWDFRKLTLTFPRLSGSAREGRLIYMVDRAARTVSLATIYSHKQFEGRPPEKSLEQLASEILAMDDAPP